MSTTNRVIFRHRMPNRPGNILKYITLNSGILHDSGRPSYRNRSLLVFSNIGSSTISNHMVNTWLSSYRPSGHVWPYVGFGVFNRMGEYVENFSATHRSMVTYSPEMLGFY